MGWLMDFVTIFGQKRAPKSLGLAWFILPPIGTGAISKAHLWCAELIFFGLWESCWENWVYLVLAESFTKAFLKINLDELPKFGNFDLLNLKTIKMGRNTSVSLGNYFEDFVDTKVSQGRFKNASEVIRAGLRLLEEEENKIQILKKAIQDGIDSGIAKDFDPKKHLESLKAKMKNNG